MAFTLIFGSVMTGPGHVNAARNSQRSYEELSEAVEQAQNRLENAQPAPALPPRRQQETTM